MHPQKPKEAPPTDAAKGQERGELGGGVVSAAGSALAFTCGSVADGTAGIVWGADVAPWEASGSAGGAGAGSVRKGTPFPDPWIQ